MNKQENRFLCDNYERDLHLCDNGQKLVICVENIGAILRDEDYRRWRLCYNEDYFYFICLD